MKIYALLFLAALAGGCSRETSPAAKVEAAAPVVAPVDYAALGYENGIFTHEGKPFTGVSTEFYKNRTMKSRYGFQAGLHHGLVEEWYENGNRKTLTHYQSGKHEGENRYWNSNGTPQVLKIWKNDVLISETPGSELKD